MEYREIREAAVEGSVISLRNLIEKDPLILDHILSECDPVILPLHIASMRGHVEFVQEILIQMPGLVEQLDSRKRSALHLATVRGYFAIVKELVTVKPETCFLRDRDGRNPLHVAAIKGHVDVLKVLVEKKPDAARVLIDRSGDTILHLCVRYNQLEALKFLVETMDVHELVNSKNNDGNTILDMAVADQQVETIEFLNTSTRIIQVKVPQILKRNDAWLEKWSRALKLAAPALIVAMVFPEGLSPFLASLMIILLLISGSPLIRRFLKWVLIVIIFVAAIAIGLNYMIYVYGLTNFVALALAAPIIMLIGIGCIALLLLWRVVRVIIKTMKHFGTSIMRRHPRRLPGSGRLVTNPK